MTADIGKFSAEFAIGFDAIADHAVDDFGDLGFDRIGLGDVFDLCEHQGAETHVVDGFLDLVGRRDGEGVGQQDGEGAHGAADLGQIGIDELQGAELLFGSAEVIVTIFDSSAVAEEGPIEIDRFITSRRTVGRRCAAVHGHGVVEIDGDTIFFIDFVAGVLYGIGSIVYHLEIALKGDSGCDALFAFAGEEKQRQEKKQELFHERCSLMGK